MEKEEKREWGEWEGGGRRGGNGNFYNLIKLQKKRKKKELEQAICQSFIISEKSLNGYLGAAAETQRNSAYKVSFCANVFQAV